MREDLEILTLKPQVFRLMRSMGVNHPIEAPRALETEKYANVSKFLRGPWLTHHTAKVTPVITLEETLAIAPAISEE